ncbi:hypothetical protein JZO67_003552 [Enterococcus sp. 665A]|uniref:Uncharacterized protein n=1 Tax=Candidatus Enterococcus ferrettii TaxID=2815324 RepID=A0ABV0ESG4_9ENTE
MKRLVVGDLYYVTQKKLSYDTKINELPSHRIIDVVAFY